MRLTEGSHWRLEHRQDTPALCCQKASMQGASLCCQPRKTPANTSYTLVWVEMEMELLDPNQEVFFEDGLTCSPSLLAESTFSSKGSTRGENRASLQTGGGGVRES